MAERLSKFCKEAGLDDFEWTAKLCKNKLETIRKKAKKLYDKLKQETGTGSAVEDGFTIEVSNSGVFLTTDSCNSACGEQLCFFFFFQFNPNDAIKVSLHAERCDQEL